MARFRQFTKRQLWQRFLVQKVPTFYMIVDKSHKGISKFSTKRRFLKFVKNITGEILTT
jgi:hypothetical protein